MPKCNALHQNCNKSTSPKSANYLSNETIPSVYLQFERGSSGGQIFAGDYKYVEGYGSYGYTSFVDMSNSVCASLKTGASLCISQASSWGGAYYC